MRSALLIIALVGSGTWSRGESTAAHSGDPAPHVLVLYSHDRSLPVNMRIDDGFRTELAAKGTRCELFAEYLDVARFPGPQQLDLFAGYLRERYAADRPRVLVAVGDHAFDFFRQRRATLFPDTPLIFITLGKDTSSLTADPLIAGVPTSVEGGLPTLDVMLKLLPRLREIVVITDASETGRLFEPLVDRERQRLESEVRVTMWARQPFAEILQKISKLSSDTAVFYLSYLRDPNGTTMTGVEAAERLARASTVPIFGQYETCLGHGIVGGKMISLRDYGAIGADIVSRILGGESPAQVGNVSPPPLRFRFDAGQLAHWQIAPKSLPPGAEILFAQPSLWREHPQIVGGVAAAVLLQACLIGGLLLQRRRLRASEALNRGTLDSLTSLVVILDRSGCVVAMNEAWRNAHLTGNGRPARIGLGVNYLEVCRMAAKTGDSSMETVIAGIELVLRGLTDKFHAEYECIIKDRRQCFEMLVLRLRVPQGGAVVKHRDITRHKDTEKELRDRDERINLAAESANLALWTIDYQRNESWMNDKGRDLFEYKEDEALSRELFLSRVHPEDRSYVEAAIERAREGPGTFEMEYRLLRPDRDIRWLIARGRYLKNERGDITELLGVAVDLTAQVKARERANEADRNLAHASRLAVVGELTASIAHEINQPLGAILSNADAAELLLESDSASLDEIRRILADIRSDDLRASETIRHLRSLSRKGIMQMRSLDLNEVAGEVVKLAAMESRRRNVSLESELAAAPSIIQGDRVHLQQVLMNLLLNSMDAMNETPEAARTLTVRTSQNGSGMIEIAVSDTGHGIPSDKLPHLFESFYTTKENGVGLGLAIARSIVDAHHGHICASNNSDVGATFTVDLPLQAANAPEHDFSHHR